MKIHFDQSITQNFSEATRREWLETNGLGGWASSTISGAHTRRYHGLLVAAVRPPVERMVLVSKIDELIEIDGKRIELGTNTYPGIIYPEGYRYLKGFSKRFFPVFVYAAAGVLLKKFVTMVYGENTTVVLYQVVESPAPFEFELRPFLAGRNYHSLMQFNDVICREFDGENGIFSTTIYDGLPKLYIAVQGAHFEAARDWYYRFEYSVERTRGMEYLEDLFTPGLFKCSLKTGDTLGIIVSTLDPRGREASALFKQEKQRRQHLIGNSGLPDEWFAQLTLAADQFIVRRDNLKTIIAGYHWFTDWGRDTMIALPGLTLATRRFEDAKKIIRAFAQSIDQGMLPNRFPDKGEAPEYNTVDATLWYFVAVYKYLLHSKDKLFVHDEILPVLEDIISCHERGTRYNIKIDEDGLLYAGEPGVQLTWMDAKVGDWVVTPRTGKAVEINALWYNALVIFAFLCRLFRRVDQAEHFMHKASASRICFEDVFWFEEGGYLYDYVSGDSRDASVRPNQIFALSLPYPLLHGKKARRVLQVVMDQLYTPFGLRSLASEDPNYHGVYSGNVFQRDSAYHQGTVWSWLLGPLITALVRIKGPEGKKQAKKIIKDIEPHLNDAGLGTISEIFDGNMPHLPRGCISQAWSVAEILRAYVEDIEPGDILEMGEMILEPYS